MVTKALTQSALTGRRSQVERARDANADVTGARISGDRDAEWPLTRRKEQAGRYVCGRGGHACLGNLLLRKGVVADVPN